MEFRHDLYDKDGVQAEVAAVGPVAAAPADSVADAHFSCEPVRSAMRRSGKGQLLAALATACGAIVAALPAAADTLDDVLKRQRLVCGVSQGLPGFSAKGPSGSWQGLDVDFCRAVSAALFGDADKIDYVPLSAEERFTALKAGKVDLLSRNSTWTMSREVSEGLEFVGVIYYDGQSFMARTEHGWSSAMEISGVSVCVQSGTTSVDNAVAYFAQQKVKNDIQASHPSRGARRLCGQALRGLHYRSFGAGRASGWRWTSPMPTSSCRK